MANTKASEAITRHRTELHWSKRRLAREAGLSAAYIVQMENGERPPTARAVGSMARAMGMPRYKLLAEAGFIPEEVALEAEQMAQRALDEFPTIAVSAHAQPTEESRFDWLVGDYMYMLGYDPYGDGYTMGPGGNHADWTPLVPDAPAPILSIIQENIDARLALDAIAAKQPTAIEGWDRLTDTNQRLVSQLVKQLLDAQGER